MANTGRVIRSFLKKEAGATMVEYGVMVALIAAVCFITVATLGTKVSQLFASVSF